MNTTLKCLKCGRQLLHLYLKSIDNKLLLGNTPTKIAVKCQWCGGFSQIERVIGQFYPGSPSDDIAFDITHNDTDAPEVDILFKAWQK